MMMERRATWRCDVCPVDNQVLRPGLHYADDEAATRGLRLHFVTEHGDLMWNPATRAQVTGTVEAVELV
jgi:hypothetical protein